MNVEPKRWFAVAEPGTPLVERLTSFFFAVETPLFEPYMTAT